MTRSQYSLTLPSINRLGKTNKNRTASRRRRFISLGLESLEARRVLAAPVAVDDDTPPYVAAEDTVLTVTDGTFDAFSIPGNTAGNAASTGSLGTDFETNEATWITHLGVFDDDGDGVAQTLTSQLYHVDPQFSIPTLVTSITFTPADPGILIGGYRYKPLATPISLPIGFTGAIVAFGFGVGDDNLDDPGLITPDDGGGVVTFGGSRSGAAGAYPSTVDGAVPRYGGGTFRYSAGVLGNDTDADGDPLTVIEIEGMASVGVPFMLPSGAVVTLRAGGGFDYDPNGQFEYLGAPDTFFDIFEYTASDGNGGTSTAEAMVAVLGANDDPTAADDAFTVVDTGGSTVLGNVITGDNGSGIDTDIDTTDVLALKSFAVQQDFAANTATILGWRDSDGNPNVLERYGAAAAGVRDMYSTYDHDNDSGTPDITIPGGLEVNHNTGNATVTASFTLSNNTDVTKQGVLSFFAGMRGNNRTNLPMISIVNITDSTAILPPTEITINADDNVWEYNRFFFPLSAGDLGDDIEIRWQGGGNNSASGLQITDVNLSTPPTFVTFTTPLGANVTLQADGTIEYDSNGQFDYLADGETRTDTFPYCISDGNGGQSEATVTITLTGVNDPLVAIDDPNEQVALQNPTATASQGGYPITETIDGDLDGNDNGWALSGNQTSGQTAVFQTASALTAEQLVFDLIHDNMISGHKINQFRLSYTTDPNPTVSSGSTWTQITPSAVETSAGTEAWVSIGNVITIVAPTLADAQTANDNYQIVVDAPVAGVTGFRLEAFAYDDGNGNTVGFGSASNGNIVLSEFQVHVPSVEVTDEESAVTIPVLDNDIDIDGDLLTVARINGEAILVGDSIVLSSGATVTLNADHSFTYNPSTSDMFDMLALGEMVFDSFEYTATDRQGEFDDATVRLQINGVNDPPVALSNAYSTFEDVAVSGNMLTDDTGDGVDYDIDNGAVLMVTAVGATSSGGLVSSWNPDGTFTYDPNGAFAGLAPGEFGTDTFTYTIEDEHGLTSTNTVTITVVGQGDECMATGMPYVVQGTSGDNRIILSVEYPGVARLEIDNQFSTIPLRPDTIFYVNGGDGDDHIAISANLQRPVFFVGGNGNDYLAGGSLDDVLIGGEDPDRLLGGHGNDCMEGGGGADRLDGREGNDMIYGQQGPDMLVGGSGEDLLDGGEDNDEVAGGSGNDIVKGGAGDDQITGESGNDLLEGGAGKDFVWGRQGHDMLFGGADEDCIFGGSGQDLMVGGGIPGMTDDELRQALDSWSDPNLNQANDRLMAVLSPPAPSTAPFALSDIVDQEMDSLTGGLDQDRFLLMGGPADDTYANQSEDDVLT